MSEKNTSSNKGVLYVVATPIGNLGDMTARAIETLKMVDKICAEDTRNTRKLLTHFNIQGDLHALHDHNEKQKIEQLKNWLEGGENIAIVSDAGTPLISDPGYHVVSALSEQNTRIVPIPGASAIIVALSIAGLATDRFTFEGFLPAKSSAKTKTLEENLHETRTQVYYESSHRIVDTIKVMREVFGEHRKVVLARELTKLYEQVFRGTLLALSDWIVDDPMHQKGEFVLVVAGDDIRENRDQDAIATDKLLDILVEELPVKQAASIAAKITGKKKNDLYRQAMVIKQR